MSFRIHLFLATLRLAKRSLRVWASAWCVNLAARVIGLSKRIGPPPPPLPELQLNEAPITVCELLSAADQSRDPVYVLRLPTVLIEITKVNEDLEDAVFNSPTEGHLFPKLRPFFAAKHRAPNDTKALL